ncbi:C-reactive protein-like [Candoia aspera]|uniref:C-reactive protein-like n=1 Tax=Candoia aspera TaxID=51853 RepID=UPI002FD7DE61
MVLLPSFLLILACLSGSFSQRDLQKKVLVFPASSNSAAVVLNVPLQQPLTKFTICLSYYSLLSRACGIFSYATRSSDNDILIYKPKSNQYSLHVGGTAIIYTVPEKQKPSWEHICMSWDSSNGLVGFWLNGQPFPRLSVKRGYSISHEASVILGQDQDSFGGGFDVNQSFVGEISDVNMWPRVLTPDEMGLVRKDGALSDHLVNWRSLDYTIKNEVFVEGFLSQMY